MAQVQIMITDLEDGSVDCEIRTSDVTNDKSPANILATFLAKYWEVICTSAQGEYTQAKAELEGKPIEAAPLRLQTEDGRIISRETAPEVSAEAVAVQGAAE